ncbi:MAG: sugar phosphate isomerase/epimerase, partial [Ginsengibacter sp.]
IFFSACNSGEEKTTEQTTEGTLQDSATFQPAWKLGIQLWTFNISTFYDAIERVDSCGLKYIEAFPDQKLSKTDKTGFGPAMSQAQRDSVKALLSRRGITITSFGVAGADNEEGWKKLFDFAKDMSIPVIVAEPSRNQWDYVDKMAGDYNIKIAIHDHPKPAHFWHYDSVLAAINGHPNIGSCADVGHWARNGLNPVDCMKALKGHIWDMHLKDITTFNKVNANDTVPGKGVIDFHAVFQELQDQGYGGAISIEHESNWLHAVDDVKEIVTFYNEQMKLLK